MTHDRTKQELLAENQALQSRVAALEEATNLHRRAADAFDESDAKLSALLENTADFVLFSDAKGYPVAFNSAYAAVIKEFFGLTMEPGVKPHELLPAGPERDVWNEAHRRVLSGEKFSFDYELRLPGVDTRILQVSYAPILKHGDVIGFSEYSRDVTDSRRSEHALKEALENLKNARSDLEHKVQERTAELRRANAALREEITQRKRLEERLWQTQKMEAIGQLAGGVAHDFNNQLTGILGNADLLLSCIDDPEHRQCATSIVEAAKRSAELTRQLLAFARKGRYQDMLVDLHVVINDVVSLLGRSIDKKVDFQVQLEAPSPITRGEPAQIHSALLNLALNARDAMPRGGTLLFRTRRCEIGPAEAAALVFEVPSGKYVVVSITDDGVGMDRATLARAFEPFFTTKPPGRGTGMGLASVYGTMKSHGGSIRVESEVGRGTSFELFFPIAKGGKPAAVQPYDRGGSLGRLSVLVVDDEPAAGLTLARMLERLGHAATLCASPHEAIATYRERWRELDLVILDMIMPKLDGREAFRALQAINPEVVALLSSGYSIAGNAQEILAEGVRGFLQKPFQLVELDDKLREILRR
jgi:PAS domain S-box-containing protein